MCWPGLPGKGVACHCCQPKCSRRCLWSGAGALDGAQDHTSQPEALAGMATSHQHWASLSPVALAWGPPHLCAPPVRRMELGGMDGHGAGTAGTCQGLLTCGESQMPWVYAPASLGPPPWLLPACCSPTRWEPKHTQDRAHPGPTGRHRIRFANLI